MNQQVLDGFPHSFGEMSQGNINSLVGAHPKILFRVDETFVEMLEEKELHLLFVKGDNPCLNIESHFSDDGEWVMPQKKDGYFVEGRTIARIFEGSVQIPQYARSYIKEQMALHDKCEVYLQLHKPGAWRITVEPLKEQYLSTNELTEDFAKEFCGRVMPPFLTLVNKLVPTIPSTDGGGVTYPKIAFHGGVLLISSSIAGCASYVRVHFDKE